MKKLFINKVKQTILEHLEDQNFGVSELASKLGLSNSQLLRKVKRITGKSANGLIREIRLNEALVLIKEGDLTAAEIAYKVGFSSPSYFSKCFHEHFGCTPGEFNTKNEDTVVQNEFHDKTVKFLPKNSWRYLVTIVPVLVIIIIIISFAVLPRIDSKHIKNIEAFNLYEKGLFFFHRRAKGDFERSKLHFEQAIKLDSSYALAYIGLADVYATMSWWNLYPRDGGYIKTMELIEKALSIDTNIAEAHAILGSLVFWYEWKPEIAEKELKQAISLNPSYATAHKHYALLLNALGRRKEAREQINLAINLNPILISMYEVSSSIYYDNREYERTIEEEKKGFEFNHKKTSIKIFKSYVHLGMNIQAIEQLKLMVPNDLNKNHALIDEIYQESGMNSVIYWFIEQHGSRDSYNAFLLYALIGNRDRVIEIVHKNPNYRFCVRTNPDFIKFKSDSIFSAFIAKISIND